MVEHTEGEGNRSSQVTALLQSTKPDELYVLIGELIVRLTAQHARRDITLGFSFIAEPELEKREGYAEIVQAIARMKPGMQLAFRASKKYGDLWVSMDGAIVLNPEGVVSRLADMSDTSETTERMLDAVWRNRHE